MNLAKALKSGNQKAARSAIESEDFDPNQTDPKTGESALHILAREDELDLLQEVMTKCQSAGDRKVDIDKKDFEDKVD